MAITEISSQTFLADAINLIRNKLLTNITDPLVSSRAGTEKFCLTSYPKRAVTYPIITIIDRNISQPLRLGMGSESTAIDITLEIRVWARNVRERDELFDSIYTYLRQNQYDADGLIDANLNGFSLSSAVNVDEPGESGIRSKVMEVTFLFICE